jgi:hypothetical protein
MFTRLSNFTYGNYKIANIQADALDENMEILIHIQKYEQQSLRLLLGDKTYTDFMANVELESGYYKVKADSDPKWDLLLNGTSYPATALNSGCHYDSLIDKNIKWSGLVKKVATIQEKDVIESLMAPYIFYYWSLNTRTLNLGTGEGRVDSKSATQESSKNKRIDAWNEFVQWASHGYSCTDVSLMKFLEDHLDLFPEVNKIALNPLTYYDI